MNKRSFFIIFVALSAFHLLTWTLPESGFTTILDSCTKSLPILWLLYGALRTKSPTLMVLGLIFSTLGDITAEINAIGGLAFKGQIGFFAIAQLMYLLSFSKYSCWKRGRMKGNEDKAVFIIVIAVFTGFVAQRVLGGMFASDTSAVLIIGCTVYMLLLMGMALAAASQDRPHYLLFVAGALLFIFSDSVIALHAFRTPVPGRSLWVMTTYYAAQYLINVTDITGRSSGIS